MNSKPGRDHFQKDTKRDYDDDDDDDDYMSDNFLAQVQDVRPGLKRTHRLEREHQLTKRKKELEEKAKLAKLTKKSAKTLESEVRNEGLQKSLDQSNKGFAMLQKMGYKEGESLGKKKDGLVNPIPIQVKTNRGGLGREAILKEIREEKQKIKQKKMDAKNASNLSQMSTIEFRAQLSLQRRQNLIQSDLYKSQKVCQQLDVDKSILEPAEIWFWPPNVEEEEEDQIEQEEEVDDVLEPHEKLFMLTTYLRQEYLYCLWCGNRFNDESDRDSNCPGRNREDHDE